MLLYLQVHKADVLRMKCSDVYLYESLINPDQFGTLPQLSQLTIEFCKLKMLPDSAFIGLKNLQQLRVQVNLMSLTNSQHFLSTLLALCNSALSLKMRLLSLFMYVFITIIFL